MHISEKVFFSVIIPLYNKEKYIANTLQSVLLQTYSNFEVIIVNDGSTDHSLDNVLKFPQDKFRIITIKNSGVSIARNTGIQAAQGDFIALLDADDYWYPNHLKNFEFSIDKFPSEKLFSNNYQIKYASNNLYQPVFSNLNLNDGTKKYSFFETSYINSTITSSTVCVETSVLQNHPFDKEIFAGEDTDLWIRLSVKYSLVFNPTVTAIYNKFISHSLSKSNNENSRFIFTQKFLKEEQNNQSLQKFMDLNRFSVLIQFLKKKNSAKVNLLKSQINYNNLNFKQRVLLSLPVFLISFLQTVKLFLSRNFNINMSVFK